MPGMRRREFVSLLGGAAALWPLVAHAQQPTTPLVGYLGGLSRDTFAPRLAAFHKGLAERGYVEGRSVEIEYRWANGQYDRLPELAADLVRRHVAVIAAMGGDAPAFAAKAASTTIPIVFAVTADPVKAGLVSSLNRPGGNITGVNFLLNTIAAKLFEVLNETVPKATTIGFLVNPSGPEADSAVSEVRLAAQVFGQQLLVVKATSEYEIDAAFATLAQQRVGALLVGNDVFFYSRREQIVALAALQGMPAIYNVREFVQAGGLMSYGTSVDDAQRQAGVYVGRILQGTKPGDLPIQQAVKVELALNLKTAKSLGITIPTSLLLRADEVIE
jgi:putative tryptophan/tyrosine transport system substrate-binding protein